MTQRKYEPGLTITSLTALNIRIEVGKIFGTPIYLRDRAISPKWFEQMNLKTLNEMIEGGIIREAMRI